MNYPQGILHMSGLVEAMTSSGEKSGSFLVGNLLISYPGYKEKGDYKLTENGTAPNHTDIVKEIHDLTTNANFNDVVTFLDDVYQNGLLATSTTFPQTLKEKIYWVTLQEEINYPQPKYYGRKLPFQRYYEGALVKANIVSLEQVYKRTNNHGSSRPLLLEPGTNQRPSFYT